MKQADTSGNGRCYFRHAEVIHEAKDAPGRTTYSCCSAPDSAQAELERGESSGKNADDRKRNSKVGESAHAAVQLLRIAHALQQHYVIRSPQLKRFGRG